MNLRAELMPPLLDAQLVARLAKLADAIDGNPSELLRSEFNSLAGTDVPMSHFQGVYGMDGHESFVQGLLRKKYIKPTPDVTREELIEVVRRAMKIDDLAEAYMAVFDANVPSPHASSLIFYPPDYDDQSGTWGDGKQMRAYDPSPDQIVDWALGLA